MSVSATKASAAKAATALAPCDRIFRHKCWIAGRLHCVQVLREEGCYSGRIIAGAVSGLEQAAGASAAQRAEGVEPEMESCDTTEPALRAEDQIFAVSHGIGFACLHEVFRSLRKDIEINAMAVALTRATLSQAGRRVLSHASTSAPRRS